MSGYLNLIFVLVLAMGCSGQNNFSNKFEKGKEMGTTSEKTEEASGLAASRKNPGYLWTLNDSGNPSDIYLLNEKAEIVMTCKLPKSRNRDWEEIFIGPGPKENTPYLYVADIGDNDAEHTWKILYRIEEPLLTEKKITVHEIEKIVFKLSDKRRDSETIFYDSISSSVCLISKREKNVNVYSLSYPFESDTLTAELKASLPFDNIVAADICPKGDEVLMKTYESVFYWKRNPGESLIEMFMRAPEILNYEPEFQGEAIAWKVDDTGYFTLSESSQVSTSKLLFYRRK
jgi:hypothetical protein